MAFGARGGRGGAPGRGRGGPPGRGGMRGGARGGRGGARGGGRGGGLGGSDGHATEGDGSGGSSGDDGLAGEELHTRSLYVLGNFKDFTDGTEPSDLLQDFWQKSFIL